MKIDSGASVSHLRQHQPPRATGWHEEEARLDEQRGDHAGRE